MNISDQFPRPHPQTAGRVIDGEAVVILADDSILNVLNPVGSRIFELADGTRSTRAISELIADEFDVLPKTAYSDTVHFIQELINKNVLELSDTKDGS